MKCATFNNALGGTLNFTSSASANKPNIQEIQVTDLSSGLYIVSIQTVTNVLSKKLIVR